MEFESGLFLVPPPALCQARPLQGGRAQLDQGCGSSCTDPIWAEHLNTAPADIAPGPPHLSQTWADGLMTAQVTLPGVSPAIALLCGIYNNFVKGWRNQPTSATSLLSLLKGKTAKI